MLSQEISEPDVGEKKGTIEVDSGVDYRHEAEMVWAKILDTITVNQNLAEQAFLALKLCLHKLKQDEKTCEIVGRDSLTPSDTFVRPTRLTL